MIYFAPVALILLSIYPISFAKYTWSSNKLASLGVALLVLAALALSVFFFVTDEL